MATLPLSQDPNKVPYLANSDTVGALAVPTEQYLKNGGLYLPLSVTNPIPTQEVAGPKTVSIDQTTDGVANRVVAKISQVAGENAVSFNDIAQPVAITGSLVNEPIVHALVANTDTLFTFSALCKRFDILNLGVGDIWYKVDGVATVAGAGCTLVPSAMGYSADIQGTVIHVISSVTPTVQIVGVR